MMFKCKICGKWEDDKHIAVVPETRKNKLGRIAWRRDGVCWECATKLKAPVDADE